ncbi:hypothetical protein ACQ4PT_032564 [Festuca glaucescens]
MKISGLLTSAGINIGLCVLFLSLYSILRKQPANIRVYFGRRIAEENSLLREAFVLERFVPSAGWIVKALQCTEEELLAAAGLDAVVFNRMLVFRLWVHCIVLYIISGVACILLYLEYRRIAKLRILLLKRATPNPGQFAVLVRGIPKTTKESCSSDVDDFFTKYHASSYLFHQVVYKAGKLQKIMTGAKKACRKLEDFTVTMVDHAVLPTDKVVESRGKADLKDSISNTDNELLNVYRTRYDTGGLYWPIAHNTVIFSLVLTQIICLGVFGLKVSPVAAGFTIPLIILTLLFNQYCRKRLLPLFKSFPAQDLVDMDREDEQSGRMEHIHHQLHTAYCQFPDTEEMQLEKIRIAGNDKDDEEPWSLGESNSKETCEERQPRRDLSHPTLKGLPFNRLQNAIRSITFLIRLQKRGLS